MPALLEQILPPGIVVVTARGDLEAELFSQEERAVRQAVGRRRREFTTGRACARAALGRLGLPPQPIPAGPDGNPRWPAGIVGSITHCRGYRAAAVARAGDFAAIGIDVEPDQPLPSGVLAVIGSAEELAWVRSHRHERAGPCWDRLLFSAKESVFKAWFPLTARKLGFADASIAFDDDGGGFSARLPQVGNAPPGIGAFELRGHWLVRDGFMVTAVALKPIASSHRRSGICQVPQPAT